MQNPQIQRANHGTWISVDFRICCGSWNQPPADTKKWLFFKILTPYQICKYFLPFRRLPFHFVHGFLLLLPRLMSESLSPVFSSRSFMVSGLIFNFLLHFELIFVYGISLQFHSFVCRCPVFPIWFIKETIISPLHVLSSFCRKLIDHKCKVSFWALYSVPFIRVSVYPIFGYGLCQHYTILITITL